ncbi:MAG: hypothetical protein FJ202_04810, partial [Gemmatimonadetes bacterium]|nr:hypothetical protein [Gemmatimonadota bacterium]
MSFRIARSFSVRTFASAVALVVLTLSADARLATAQAAAQAAAATTNPAKRALSSADYTRWRQIEGAQISSDGKWVASVWRFTNVPQADTKPELHLRNTETNQEVVIPNASNSSFSLDAKWVVYQVDSVPVRAPAGRGGRGGAADSSGGAAVPGSGGAGGGAGQGAAPAAQGGRGNANTPLRRFDLRELATGTTTSWKDIASATFSATSSHLLLRRRPATAGGAAG